MTSRAYASFVLLAYSFSHRSHAVADNEHMGRFGRAKPRGEEANQVLRPIEKEGQVNPQQSVSVKSDGNIVRRAQKMAPQGRPDGSGAPPQKMQAPSGVTSSLPQHIAAASGKAAPKQVRHRAKAECEHNRTKAVSNYRKGKGAIWFFHITHNAGTTWRDVARQNDLAEYKQADWRGNTGWFQEAVRQGHGVFAYPWEESMLPHPGLASLDSVVPCSSDAWVSVIAMRDPILRILATDGAWVTTNTTNLDACNTDNYGLRNLIGREFGQPVTQDDVELAKRRLDSFDFVLDVADLSNSMQLMCDDLGWKNCEVQVTNGRKKAVDPKEVFSPAVYEKLVARNKYELELYEYAKDISRRMNRNADRVRFLNTLTRTYPNFELMVSKTEHHLKWGCQKALCANC